MSGQVDILKSITFPGELLRRVNHSFFHYLCSLDAENQTYESDHYTPIETDDPESEACRDIITHVGAFVMNSTLALMLGTLAWLDSLSGDWWVIGRIVLMWLAISMAMNAFGNREEAKRIWSILREYRTCWIAKSVGGFLAMIMLAGTVRSVLRLDLVYGAVIGIGLPWLMVG